jgi:hypothetical protein
MDTSSNRGSELVIALVGAVGTDLDAIIERLKVSFSAVDCDCEVIRLSQCLIDGGFAPGTWANHYERTNALMTAGDDFCKTLKLSHAVAALAVREVKKRRKAKLDAAQGAVP